MTRNQRITTLAAALLIAVVAFVALRPDGDAEAPRSEPATQTPATPPASASQPAGGGGAAPEPKPPLLKAGGERTLEFKKGDTVRFRVTNPAAEEVHVHGYDLMKDLPAGKTVAFAFKATIEGIFEVELEQSGTPLGELRIDP